MHCIYLKLPKFKTYCLYASFYDLSAWRLKHIYTNVKKLLHFLNTKSELSTKVIFTAIRYTLYIKVYNTLWFF